MQSDATPDSYIAALHADQARALNDLRAFLKTLLPDASEVMSYAMPGFRQNKMIVGYAAFRKQCGLYPHSGNIIPKFANELRASGRRFSGAGVNFTPDDPLPPDLVRRIVQARLDEVAGS